MLENNVSIDGLFKVLAEHEWKFKRSFSLIPSENTLSPLARVPFLSDAYSRYFFDEHVVFGRWSFEGGSIAGRIQTEIVVPLLRELGRAEFVNVHPVSGLTGMTLALSAFGVPGRAALSVPVAVGGHPDTSYVGSKLGFHMDEIPFAGWRDPDLPALARRVEELQPALVYVDHATALVPLDLRNLISAIREASSSRVHVHVDSSHVNGLVWGGQLAHPLECGADTYGGSTHKTFAGPHKAVLFTNDADLAEQLTLTAVNMISHHHLAEVISLGVALLEFRDCGGSDYAAQVIRNAQAFGAALRERSVGVEAAGEGITQTHQVWARAPQGVTAHDLGSELFEAGLVVNPYSPIPSIGDAGIRMGLNEPTKLGAKEADTVALADAYAAVAVEREEPRKVAEQVAELRSGFEASYCFDDTTAAFALAPFVDLLTEGHRHYVSIGHQVPDRNGETSPA